MTHGRESELEIGKWSEYPVSYQLTPWLAAVNWSSTPAELHGLVHFTERQNHCNCSKTSEVTSSFILFQNIFLQLLTYLPFTLSCKATQSNIVIRTRCTVSYIILNCKTHTQILEAVSQLKCVQFVSSPKPKTSYKMNNCLTNTAVCIPISGL